MNRRSTTPLLAVAALIGCSASGMDSATSRPRSRRRRSAGIPHKVRPKGKPGKKRSGVSR